MKIAVLGGGLTGLSAVFHLSRRFPKSQITLLEKQARLGGWVSSQRVSVNLEDGKQAQLVLEQGPRTLRPNSEAVFELIHLLKLQDQLILTPKTAPAARNRFIYIPPGYNEGSGLAGLIKLPNSLHSLWKSPLRQLILPAILSEPFKRTSGAALVDSSLHDLLETRFGPSFARLLGSALVHGIYAADSRAVSAQSAFGSLFYMARDGGGSVLRGALRHAFGDFVESQKAFRDAKPEVDYDSGDVANLMEHQNTSVFSFMDGLQALPSALEENLAQQPNIKIIREADVSSISARDRKQLFDINVNNQSLEATHVVSALPTPSLYSILSPTTFPALLRSPLLSQSQEHFSTVTVINLVFPLDSVTPSLHPAGFGMLIPRPPSSNPTANPLGVLGVVFDSSSLSSQDSTPERTCKMTVMLGGPYSAFSPIRTSDVLSFLSTALGNPLPGPIHVTKMTHKECIPHPRVGHAQLVKDLWKGEEREWVKSRFEIVGPGITGVSVGDCISAGRSAGNDWQSTL